MSVCERCWCFVLLLSAPTTDEYSVVCTAQQYFSPPPSGVTAGAVLGKDPDLLHSEDTPGLHRHHQHRGIIAFHGVFFSFCLVGLLGFSFWKDCCVMCPLPKSTCAVYAVAASRTHLHHNSRCAATPWCTSTWKKQPRRSLPAHHTNTCIYSAGTNNHPKDPDAGVGDDFDGVHVHVRAVAEIRHLSRAGGFGSCATHNSETGTQSLLHNVLSV